MSIRIVIADDHGVLRAGLRALLEGSPLLQVVGEAPDGPETLRLAQELLPDVILLDISMPGPGGIKVIQALRAQVPETRLLVLTAHEDEGLLRQALQAGATGYIPKRAVGDDLISAIHAVHRGEIYVHSSLNSSLVTHFCPSLADVGNPTSRTVPPPAESLTRRETEVLRLIALGYANREIAELLFLSARTIERYRANLMSKLGLHGRSALVRYARENGLLD